MSMRIIRILHCHFRERNCPKWQDRSILSFLVSKGFLHRLQFNTAAGVTAHSHNRSGSIPFSFPLLWTSTAALAGAFQRQLTEHNHCCQMGLCLFSKLDWLSDTFHKQQQAEHKGGHRQISLCRKLPAVSHTSGRTHSSPDTPKRCWGWGAPHSDCPGDMLAFASATDTKCNLTTIRKLLVEVKYSENSVSTPS